jgi:hypothetical protein
MASARPAYRMNRPSEDQARTALGRVFGPVAGDAFWSNACQSAGLAAGAIGDDLEALARVGDALARLGGPAGASAVALIIRIRAYQALSRAGSLAEQTA